MSRNGTNGSGVNGPGAARGGMARTPRAPRRSAASVRGLRRLGLLCTAVVLAVLGSGAGVFALSAASPANPLSRTVSTWEFASAQARENLAAAYDTGGWFLTWLQWMVTAVTTGDLGYSRILHAPVTEIILTRGLNTLAASAAAALLTALVVGIVCLALARVPDLARSRVGSGVLATWLAVPSFLIAVLIVVLWGPHLPDPARSAPIVLVPGVAVTIALAWSAPVIATARSAAAEVWTTPWARALIGRGVPAGARVRLVLPPVVRAAANQAVILVPGIVVGEAAVEAVLAFPGLGNALVQAAAGADLPLLATATVIAAAVTTVLVILARGRWAQGAAGVSGVGGSRGAQGIGQASRLAGVGGSRGARGVGGVSGDAWGGPR